MNPLELLRELVERHVIDPVAAHIAGDAAHVIGAVAGDFHAVGLAFFASTSTQAGGCVLQVVGGTEAPALRFDRGGGNHRDGGVLVSKTTKTGAVAAEASLQAAAAVAAKQLEAPGELLQGAAGFSAPTALEGHGPFTEVVLVVAGIQEAVDIGFIAVAIEALGVGAHLLEINRGAAQEMAEGQLDVAVARAVVKKAGAVEIALGQAAHELAHADFTELELGFDHQLPLAFHDVGVPQHLPVDRTNDLFLPCVVVTRKELKGSVAIKALDTQKRCGTKRH